MAAENSEEMRALFVDEARERVQALNEGLLQYEGGSADDPSVLQEIFRAVHTIKGMAGTMGYEPMVELSHALESVFDELRSAPSARPPEETFDLLFSAASALETMVETVASGGNLDAPDPSWQALTQALRQASRSGGTAVPSSAARAAAEVGHTAVPAGTTLYSVEVRLDPHCSWKGPRAYTVLRALEAFGPIVSTQPPRQALEAEQFDDRFVVLLATHEPRSRVEAAALGVSEVRAAVVTEVPASTNGSASSAIRLTKSPGAALSPESTVRVETARLDALVELVGELVVSASQIEDRYQQGQMPEESHVDKLGRVTADLQHAVMRLRMVPLRQVFSRFPRSVRDLARALGKQVEFIVEGEETELDRSIVNAIGEPLLHLIRNAVDHGIEPPEERRKAGKPASGRIRLSARHEGNGVIVELEDDGAGIDVERIRRKAIDSGRLSAQEAASMPAEQLIQLIFEPGFSTAKQVTDVSGRGVGMDAAKAVIESLGGRLVVETRRGYGTRCIVRLPLTLAIIRALLVEAGGQLLGLPSEAVQSIESVDDSHTETVRGQRVLRYRDRLVPLVSLQEKLDLPPSDDDKKSRLAVVLSTGSRYVALLLPRVVGLQDLVIRSLGGYLKVPGVAGAAILGSGRIALILDPLWLV
ncbi:chemotaxis protein CheA [Carboxydochorda subterranea]|uniref:Chemotaxis protein CheA n=1 Tax=Carboxydichorda subterranea TaxID=3109565 RepID=A0ABZ1BYK4_9FIRM|nr:chemotaxis protein CheA [Limnochorda sp. L945t]WRP17889.1 chemotaxis protein CheA [Limnochorda sp. L945t]